MFYLRRFSRLFLVAGIVAACFGLAKLVDATRGLADAANNNVQRQSAGLGIYGVD